MSLEWEKNRDRGREQLKLGNYKKSIDYFTKAINGSISDNSDNSNSNGELYLLYSNRSLANFLCEKYEDSLLDSNQTIQLKPDWIKGYFRKGEVLIKLMRYDEAKLAFTKCLSLDFSIINKTLIEMRMLEAELTLTAPSEGIILTQLIPGRDICKSTTYNPITKIIYEIARQMQNIIYIIGDYNSGDVMVVDGCWDVDGILQYCQDNKLAIQGIIITHNHFDHVGGKPPSPFDSFGVQVSGAAKLLERLPLDIKLYCNYADADLTQIQTEIDPIRISPTVNNQIIKIGQVDVKFIHTPGHTKGSQCILVGEKRLLTGDTLFPGSHGRTDLPGGSPEEMHHSLHNILAKLDDKIGIYPGHCYGGKLMTSIGYEKDHGVLFQPHSSNF